MALRCRETRLLVWHKPFLFHHEQVHGFGRLNYAAPGKKCSIMPPNGSDMFVIREIWLLPGYKAVL